MALFCDVESIAVAMRSVNVEDLDLEGILQRLGEKGKVAHKRAYGDWHRLGDLEDEFRAAGLEVVDMPPAAHSSRSLVSIQLALDALELCYSDSAPEVFVLFSAEADLAPLVAKLKEADKQVLGMGIHDAVLPVLAEVCDEFIFCNDPGPAAAVIEEPEAIDENKSPLFAVLVEIIESLQEEGGDVLWGSRLKREMRQREPDLDLDSHGYATFSELLEDADRHHIIHLERDDRSGSYYVEGEPGQ